jgi:hypothetical protein
MESEREPLHAGNHRVRDGGGRRPDGTILVRMTPEQVRLVRMGLRYVAQSKEDEGAVRRTALWGLALFFGGPLAVWAAVKLMEVMDGLSGVCAR